MAELLLGVNIDHIATVRNARGTNYPDPVQAAFIAEQAGADGITVHLREDRRHITDRDVRILRDTIQTRMNLEMAVTDEMIGIACDIQPHFCCLVPEKRQEVTTEGGLDVAGQQEKRTRLYDCCVMRAFWFHCLLMPTTARSKRPLPQVRLISKFTPALMPRHQRDGDVTRSWHAFAMPPPLPPAWG